MPPIDPSLTGSEHDASTGFHDIKPLPEFHPRPDVSLWLLLAAAFCLIGLILWWRFGRKHAPPATALLPPEEEAERTIESLLRRYRAQESSGRVFAQELSFALRRYLGRALEFAATDRTSSEINAAFADILLIRAGTAGGAERTELAAKLKRMFRVLDHAAFSGEGRSAAAAGELEHAAARAREIIHDTAAILRRAQVAEGTGQSAREAHL